MLIPTLIIISLRRNGKGANNHPHPPPPLQLLSMIPTSYIQYYDHFIIKENRKRAERGAKGIGKKKKQTRIYLGRHLSSVQIPYNH